METRESRESNDIFFVCSFIEYLARTTKNKRRHIVNALGYEQVEKLYDFADVYHCDNIDELTDIFTGKYGIEQGDFNNIDDCGYSVPDYWDMGRVYNNLIMEINKTRPQGKLVDILFEVYNSWITEYIDDYNSDMYYSNPGYIYESYKNGSILKE